MAALAARIAVMVVPVNDCAASATVTASSLKTTTYGDVGTLAATQPIGAARASSRG